MTRNGLVHFSNYFCKKQYGLRSSQNLADISIFPGQNLWKVFIFLLSYLVKPNVAVAFHRGDKYKQNL